MADIFLHTIGDWYMAQDLFQDGDAVISNFQIPVYYHFGPPVTLKWPISICTPNLVQTSQELAEIHLFILFKMSL